MFARARDRVSTIASLYGTGSPDLDYAGMAKRAEAVEMTGCDVRHEHRERHSSRTNQTHGVGGFTGQAAYRGNVSEFVPILKAAQWTGVGRHCVWGNGAIELG